VHLKDKLPGLALAAIVASASKLLAAAPWAQAHGFSPLTLAIVLGLLAGNTFYPAIAAKAGAGIGFSRQTILRTGVVLYGFRLSLQQVGSVGWAGVLIDAVVVLMTVVIAYQVGTRWLKMDRTSALLVGSGSAICGAAAVLATEPVVRGKSEQVSVAVAGVVIFGTLSMFLYPLLYALDGVRAYIPGGPHGFGVYIGSTIHEVAQVVAAGRQVGPEAAGPALIAKMTRVFMLAPFLVGLALWMRGRGEGHESSVSAKQALAAVPTFAFYFVGAVLLNSLNAAMGWFSAAVTDGLFNLAVFLLSMAMAALGMSTHFGTLRRAGGKALLLTGILFIWLVVGGAALNHYVLGAWG
jgi:uncharacterized integral membrane protein (TIGR00698 family)